VLSKLAEHSPHHFTELFAELLSTVAHHHFTELFAEPDGDDFWLFGSTIKPFGSIVEPTVNALSARVALGVSKSKSILTII
jgi:hypothetical protein